MTSPSLASLLHPAFRLVLDPLSPAAPLTPDDLLARVPDATAGLAAVLSASPHATAATFDGARPVVEVPATNPRDTLVNLEAAWRLGAVPVPSMRARAFSVLGPPFSAAPPEAALGIRTSGSTGAPRLPIFTFDSLALSAARIAAYLGRNPDDRVAILQPLDHGFGLVGQLFTAAVAGAQACWCSRPFPDERAAAIAAARANVISAVPHTLAQLAEHLPDYAPELTLEVRQVGSAGGPLTPQTARRLVAAFPYAVIWNQYGCTEAGPRLTAVPSTHRAFFTGTVGRAIPGVELWIAPQARPTPTPTPAPTPAPAPAPAPTPAPTPAPAPTPTPAPAPSPSLPYGQLGEIVFSSDVAMLGYLGDPTATAAALRPHPSDPERHGWHTGDLGILDGEDRLHVVGRSDDIVKLRGEKVSLDAVAAAATGLGAFAAIALLTEPTRGAPDGTLVLVYEGHEALSAPALARRLPPGAVPRRLLWVPSIPRLPSGKLDRVTTEALVLGDEPFPGLD